MGAEVFHSLKAVLKEKGHVTGVGDEGGFAPQIRLNKEALDLLLIAIEKAGYKAGEDILLALDVAASELFKARKYKIDGKTLKPEEFDHLLSVTHKKLPDHLYRRWPGGGDWEGWQLLTKKCSSKTQLIGDDVFVTNPLQDTDGKALRKGIANSILIKLNQIGTVTETLDNHRDCQAGRLHLCHLPQVR